MNALTPEEVLAIQMSLSGTIDDLQEVQSNPSIPFTPDARKDMRDILRNMKSAHEKIAAASGGNLIRLDPYIEGDEKEFLTKQS